MVATQLKCGAIFIANNSPDPDDEIILLQVERFFPQCQSNIRHCRKNGSTCSIRQCCLDIVAGVDSNASNPSVNEMIRRHMEYKTGTRKMHHRPLSYRGLTAAILCGSIRNYFTSAARTNRGGTSFDRKHVTNWETNRSDNLSWLFLPPKRTGSSLHKISLKLVCNFLTSSIEYFS